MQNNTVETIHDYVSFTGHDPDSVSYAYAERVESETKAEQAKRKASQQAMLESLFDSRSGATHCQSDELMDLILTEYKVNMVEKSSGNGLAHNVYNDETGEFDYYLSADTSEQSQHAQIGLESALIDDSGEICNKNISEIPEYETIELDDGSLMRIDDMSKLVKVDDSNYSIWDTIFEKGMLIVRHSGHWKLSGCRFDKEHYKEREARRMTKKHNRLLGLTVTSNPDGNNGTLKKIAIKRLNEDKKGNKHLTRLAREARRGKSWAIDELTKIGYNEFA